MTRGTADADGRRAVVEEIERTLARCGARGFLSAWEVGRPDDVVDLGGDEPVVAASVIKILVAVAFARAATDGTIDPRERATVPSRHRIGGTGTAGCLDPVEMSLRDLASSMMSVSDNAATDVVHGRLGAAAVDEVVDDLELTHTHFRDDMLGGALGVVAELGLPGPRDLDAQLAGADETSVRGLSWLDPARANVTTARDVARLLDAVWTDRAGSPEACAMVRGLMSHQVTTQRLASGFPGDDVTVASKTGTLPTVRNEAGVVGLADGRRFVVSLFTRTDSLRDRQPALDAAIGRAGALAVAYLRTA